MLQQQARVSRIEPGLIHVIADNASACGQCMQRAQCGSAVLAKWMPPRELAIPSPALSFKVGETVTVSIAESHLLRAALFVYLIPLLLMLTTAAISSQFDFPPAIPTLIALMAGFLLIHRMQWRFLRLFMAPPSVRKIP